MIAALAGVAYASGSWDEAKSKADEAKRNGEETQKRYVEATKKIVGAMCQARELDGVKDAGRSEASNQRSNVRDKLDSFHHSTKEAIDILDKLDDKDPHHSDASSLKRELESAREKLDDKTRKIVDGSPEFIDQIAQAADSAKSDHRGRCTQKDFSADGERISCMIKESDTCYVVVQALDNSSSTSNARDRARRGAEHIQSEMKKSSPTREVNGCAHVEARVDCLKVCPDVSDDGRVSDPRASWHERCQ